MPPTPEEPGIPRSVVIWTLAGVIILVVGLLAALLGLKLLEKKVAEQHQQPAGVSAPAKP